VERNVIVLDENTIEKSHAMIHASSAGNRVFIQHAKAGYGLARIYYASPSALNAVDKPPRDGRDAAHALKDVDRGPLGNQHGSCRAVDFSKDGAGVNDLAVSNNGLKAKPRIDKPDDFLDNLKACDYKFLFGRVTAARKGLAWDCCSGRDVAGTDVFTKSAEEGVAEEMNVDGLHNDS
jgi:hypothetical protein